MCITRVAFNLYFLILIPTLIRINMHNKVYGEITYPFPNFSDCIFEVWKWISIFIPQFLIHANKRGSRAIGCKFFRLCQNPFGTWVMIFWKNKINIMALQWHHNGHGSISNHQPHDCLLNRWFRCRSKKTSKLRVTGLCAGNSQRTGECLAQMASNTENVSIWWRHHGCWCPGNAWSWVM